MTPIVPANYRQRSTCTADRLKSNGIGVTSTAWDRQRAPGRHPNLGDGDHEDIAPTFSNGPKLPFAVADKGYPPAEFRKSAFTANLTLVTGYRSATQLLY